MSAECNKCGSDLVYPEGSWPLGECPSCTRDKQIEELERALRIIDRLLTTVEGDDVPAGEAPKREAREIARAYLRRKAAA